jgi:hypothetical protein
MNLVTSNFFKEDQPSKWHIRDKSFLKIPHAYGPFEPSQPTVWTLLADRPRHLDEIRVGTMPNAYSYYGCSTLIFTTKVSIGTLVA